MVVVNSSSFRNGALVNPTVRSPTELLVLSPIAEAGGKINECTTLGWLNLITDIRPTRVHLSRLVHPRTRTARGCVVTRSTLGEATSNGANPTIPREINNNKEDI